eukprot:CAMPEP_0118716264 /NCGR_PEP_ID=MMETSP0800-20121206/27393_1 /TAXON_ID=210618 ORGANISM="Striatella unipunctata, Strain CCMP2910" /NCGR_SAMPLE_ID=MMETSP0800 /ASSEMBLY_ACC=CAM_ASM_000638 /LENGTH=113 /DNA_ID=CAMNT_0006622643 /DNA_START=40 /DNA_END=381 /DNA_ORIENTATION=-
METNCMDIFSLNNLTSVQECVEIYTSLPKMEIDLPGYVDGKTQGCRELHAAFAATNDKHCPHLSFEPVWDDNCELKCQESKRTPLLDVWTQDEVDFLVAHEDYAGLPGGFVYE